MSSKDKITPLVQKEDLQEQACDWISKIDRGLDNHEKQQLQIWVNVSGAHKQALFDMANLWDDMSALHELSQLFPLKSATPDATTSRQVWSASTRYGIAASFALLTALSGTFVYQTIAPNYADNERMQANTYRTQVGQQKPFSLLDGSVLHLNTDSEVRVRFVDDSRLIELVKGEAHFDVAHDKSRPFIVSAGDQQVTAVGTAFNVHLSDDEVELLVTEGKVRVETRVEERSEASVEVINPSAITEAVDLQSPHAIQQVRYFVAGEKVTLHDEFEPSQTLALDQVQKDLAWQQGMLVFQGEPLVDALAEVSRYSAIEFTIMDEGLRDLRVAGYFKAGDIDGLLATLKHNFAIQSSYLNDSRVQLSI